MKTEHREFLLTNIQKLNSVGYTQREIATELQISPATVNNYLHYSRQQSKEKIAHHLDVELPNEYANTLVALNLILKEAYLTSKETTIDRRTKLNALALAQSCLQMKVELLNAGTIVERAIQFVKSHGVIHNNNNNKDGGLTDQNEELDIDKEAQEQAQDIEQEEDTIATEQEQDNDTL